MDVEAEIARLETLSSIELSKRWLGLVGGPVPRVSPKMLRLALAWELQASAYGGVSRAATRQLDQLERGVTKTTPAR
jgi:hypothetical protein